MSATEDAQRDAALLALLRERNGRMHSEVSIAHGRGFATRPSDVFIVTYPKCGTTWVTAIAHLLRGGSFDDFGEITEAVPWDVIAQDCGQDCSADQPHLIRLFKSHEHRADIAGGAKYIYVARNPDDALVSFFNFLPPYMGCQGLSLETFADGIFGGLSHSGGIWDHITSWWACRNEADVLWLAFEDLKEDPHREVKRIANFLGVDADAAFVLSVVEQTSLKAMAAQGSKFDDHFAFQKLKSQIGFSEDARHSTSKVQSGQIGKGKQLPVSVKAVLDKRWATSVAAKTGLCNYAALRNAIAESHGEAR
ncbi:P-loop containing nucleoside triphosphate hydrolase protein [Pelagophyceae sp. CCMP2097]|nr:P-loop containing nucleoside triphosphate hydrolase protein [Pelagophyceae sp. CCMP2097]